MKVLDNKCLVIPLDHLKHDNNSGRIICECRNKFTYDVEREINVGEWCNQVKACCPKCYCVIDEAVSNE